MKKVTSIIAALTIVLVGIGNSWAKDCVEEYQGMIDRLKSSREFSQETKDKVLITLEAALQLCRNGSTEEAQKLIDKVKDDIAPEKMKILKDQGN